MPLNPTEARWRACYDALAAKLVLYARQWAASQAEAEDIVQAAFVRFWRHHPDADEDHYPLLYAIVRTVALDAVRGKERRSRREMDDRCELTRADRLWFDSTLEQQEDASGIQAALERLSAEQREIIVLKIWGELTFAQIAQTLGESINTVSSRYRYALGALRRHMNPHEYERV